MVVEKCRIAVVGAGPAGLLCANTLARKGGEHFSITLYERGPHLMERRCPLDTGSSDCWHCEPCARLSGVGGACFFHDMRLSLAPAGTGLVRMLGTRYGARQRDVIDYLTGIAQRNLEPTISSGTLDSEAKCYTSLSAPREIVFRAAQTLVEELCIRVSLHTECEVSSIRRKGKGWLLFHSTGADYFDLVVVAIGKANWVLPLQLQRELSLLLDPFYLEYGCRIEFPATPTVKAMAAKGADVKLQINLGHGVSARSFCWHYPGRSIRISIEGIVCLEGQPGSSPAAGLSFALLVRDPSVTMDHASEYVESIRAKQANQLAGLPISQSLLGFLEDTREDTVAPSCLLPSAVGSVADLLGPRHSALLKQAIRRMGIDRFPAAESAWIMAPCLERVTPRFTLDSFHSSSAQGLYFIGDCTGTYRGALQAAIAGYDLGTLLNPGLT